MPSITRPFRPKLAYSADRVAPVEPCLTQRQADRFRAEVMPHMDAAYRYARYLAGDAAAAEDIVQNAFVRAFRAFAGFHGQAPKAWLLAIVRNCCFDWAKANRMPMPEQMADVDPETPETILERKANVAIVRETVEHLPEPFREALVLRELEEMSYKDIATLTQVPLGTVMSRLARAREMFAKLLPTAAQAGGRVA
jgi:RNA polymerase sigma-70 factor (ECF subfamily)